MSEPVERQIRQVIGPTLKQMRRKELEEAVIHLVARPILDHLWPCPHGVAVCEPCAYDRGYAAARLEMQQRERLRADALRARLAAMSAAVAAYHAQFQKVATCTDDDVDGHIQTQMALHAVMLRLAREEA